MAQVILSAAGRAIGGPVGGAIGRALGHAIDRTAINNLSPAREVGRIAGVKISGSAQGDPVAQVFGRARVAGQVIWAARLKENRDRHHASKTAPASDTFTYTLSFAIALCDGPIDGIGRLWADGQLLDQSRVSYRLYRGDESQTPDALIAAIEGSAPAYRGTAYMVFEDFDLTPFGNRPPSLSVEVFRRPRGPHGDLESKIEGVCLIPGAGEFVYATEPNALLSGLTRATWETQHTGDGRTDFMVSLDQMAAALPNLKRVNLVVAWFGTSTDAGTCRVRPGVEARDRRTTPLSWLVAGYTRDTAHLITQADGRPVYGGTPDDATVIAAIAELKARGYDVTLVPFLLMDCDGFPWRGRITGSVANLESFVGEWGAFVRHIANLGFEADSILLGSELRGLTTIRDDAGGYPFVAALRDLAAEVRAIVPHAKISYGADWSEYFGHQTADGVWFHLDPLWADANIDFVGIDWYAPLSDWRDGDHLDAADAPSIYDPDYLMSRVAGGEDYDWYYASDADRDAQVRTPITDGYGEPWVFRAKALAEWWSHPHHNRPGWVREPAATAWVPQSKPVRLLEIGCGAIDKGPNAPNRFLDSKSTESAVPPYSTGARDDRAQRAYLMAFADYYTSHNPVSTVYGDRMLSGMDVWCWDARPYPAFPGRGDVWGDSENWRTGHWLNGRVGGG